MNDHNDTASRLAAVKFVHTIVWAFFASCIVAIPVVAWFDQFTIAAILAAVVFIEVIILLVYRWSCPLTAIAARYTDNREPNFDIYLPKWLARHNKTIFGVLYVGGMVFSYLLSIKRG